MGEAPFFALLGLYNLGSGYLRFADDLRSDALLEQRPEPSICRFSGTVPRVRNYLWIILVVDFLIEELLGRVFGLHSFRILCLPLRDASVTLTENRTISFMMGLLAGYAQNRVLRLLQRRTVLLRLLGARTAMQAGLVLLLMGAQAVVHQSKTINFLKDSSPTPRWCCVVLWIRKYAAIVGFSMPLIFGSLSSPFFLGTLSTDTRVFIAVAVGLVSGFMVSSSFSTLWEEKREDLLENYRVLHLFPHMSAQARNKAIGVMRLAWKRGAEVASGAAVEWATSRVVRSTLGWLAQSIVRA